MYSLPNNIERRLYVKILFSTTSSRALAETAYFRNDMTIEFYFRWKWFFEYRAALLKMKNPRAIVTYEQGAYDYVLPEDELRTKLENKIRAAKGKITEFESKLKFAQENWNELFPIQHHPDWTKIVQKREAYLLQLNLLTTEYESLTTQHYEQR